MKNFEYIGLFLTEESKTKLKAWLWENDYDFNNDLIKGTLPENWYLDHCTLIHKSQVADFDADEFIKTLGNTDRTIVVTHIGVSDKVMAFKVTSPTIVNYCINEIPHITICTFNGGKPVDSNNITEWKDIKPIIVETKLDKR